MEGRLLRFLFALIVRPHRCPYHEADCENAHLCIRCEDDRQY